MSVVEKCFLNETSIAHNLKLYINEISNVLIKINCI